MRLEMSPYNWTAYNIYWDCDAYGSAFTEKYIDVILTTSFNSLLLFLQESCFEIKLPGSCSRNIFCFYYLLNVFLLVWWIWTSLCNMLETWYKLQFSHSIRCMEASECMLHLQSQANYIQAMLMFKSQWLSTWSKIA